MKETLKAIIVLLSLVSVAAFALAEPYGPSTTQRGSDQRANFSSAPSTLYAQAGNLTEITISTAVLSKRWQAFYGNITGGITLESATGQALYEWSGDISASGEVYAANETVSDWSLVRCLNTSPSGLGFNCTGQNEWCLNLTSVEGSYGILPNDPDGVNETFNDTKSIAIGLQKLINCPGTNLYSGDNPQTLYWNETILTLNNSNTTLIFASQVEQNAPGYGDSPNDFQLMVLENGDVEGPTPYEFYVELT
jgi:hypothetical protein